MNAVKLTLLVLLAAPSVALANHRTVDERREVTPDVTILVRNVAGELRIAGWQKSEVAITGELGDGVDRVDVTGTQEQLEVRVVRKKTSHGDGEADLVLQVPRGARIDIETVSADIEARDLMNKLEVESVSGDIQVSGRLREMNMRTVSGDIIAKGVAERGQLKSVSGEITLSDANGDLELETVSGEIRLSGEGFTRLRCKSVSGELQIEGDLSREASVSLESHSGDVILALPASTPATFEISTFSGEVRSELGGTEPQKKKHDHDDECDEDDGDEGDHRHHGPGSRLRFTLGSGGNGARVAVKTFSGDVLVRKR